MAGQLSWKTRLVCLYRHFGLGNLPEAVRARKTIYRTVKSMTLIWKLGRLLRALNRNTHGSRELRRELSHF
jgi:hypothetical protein